MSTKRKAIAARLRQLLGFDFHTLNSFALRAWGIVAGGITAILLPFGLSSSEVGFYYTLASMLALQVFFELGLNQVIVQLVSHEAAHLLIHEDGRLTGDAYRLGRLSALRGIVSSWYFYASILFSVFVGSFGFLFFERHSELQSTIWIPIWLIVVGCYSVNLYLSPHFAIVEGIGHVGQVARFRLIQSLISYSIVWISLFTDAKLWVAVVLPVISAITNWLWLYFRTENLHQKLDVDIPINLSWRNDIFPLQWKLALSWISGYFVFNLFTPVIFAYHGSVEAGRFGIAMAIFTAITTVGVSWVNAKSPTIIMHISRNESAALENTFRLMTIRSVSFTGILCLMVVIFVSLATIFNWTQIQRIVDIYTLIAIAIATTVNVLIYAFASYMRAHREEPMLPISLVASFCTILGVMFTAKMSIVWMMIIYASISGLIALPWTLVLFNQYRERHTS